MSKARSLSAFISDPAIDASEIGSNAVTTDKILDSAVTHTKLHTNMDLTSKTVTFADNHISGNKIHGGVISDFASTGIDDNATGTAVTIDSSGNVGIGTASPSPSYKLDVNGSIAARGGSRAIVFDNLESTGRYGIGFGAYNGLAVTTMFANVGYGSAAVGLGFDNNGTITPSLIVRNSGNVGIGTSSPNANLHIGSGNAVGDATNPAIQLGGTNTYRLGLYTTAEGGVIDAANGDDGLSIHTKAVGEAMNIASDGTVKYMNRHVVARGNGGGETGAERAAKHWMWRLASDRVGVSLNYAHSNGNYYGLYFFNGTNKLQYDISLNNATYLYLKAIYHNNADSSARTGIIQWNEYDDVWVTLAQQTFTSSGGTVVEGTQNWSTPYGRYLRVRFGFSSNGSNSILIGTRHIEFKTDGELRFHKCLGR